MNMNSILFIVLTLLTLNIIQQACAQDLLCPSSSIVYPCLCKDTKYVGRNIYCGGDQYIDLVQVFKRISQSSQRQEDKYFSTIYLNNTAITELKAHTFSDIKFNMLFIYNSTQLEFVDSNAFDRDLSVYSIYSQIYITDNPKLNNSILTALSNIEALDGLLLANNDITEIPTNAFGTLKVTHELLLIGKSIQKISDYAFKNMSFIKQVNIESTAISYIPDHAFEFSDAEPKKFNIVLNDNKLLNSNGFSVNSLTHLKNRDVYMSLDLTYLEEQIFWPYFEENEKNGIFISTLDCNDSRNKWISLKKLHYPRIIGSEC